MAIAKQIMAIGNAMRTHGNSLGEAVLNLDFEGFSRSMEFTTAYRGEGQYPGHKITVAGQRVPAKKTCWSNGQEVIESDYYELVLKVWTNLKQGDKVVITDHLSNIHRETWVFDGQILVHVSGYHSDIADLENRRVFLPKGIRQKVAEKLGHDLDSNDFNTVFDQAVELLESDHFT